MGQGKSSLNNKQLYNPSEYDVHEKISEVRYGQMTLLVNKATQQQYAAIYKTIQDEKDFELIAGEASFRSQLSHPNLIKLVNYNTKKQDEFCSSFHSLGLLYEYYNNNLQIEISERQEINLPYKEGEIWYLAETLLSVVQYLKQNKVAHQDIRPFNVAIDIEGTIKVGEVFSNLRPVSSFAQIVNHQLEDIYLSPQQLGQLNNFQLSPGLDVDKAEIYAVGMTLLNAATLENVSEICYDMKTLTVKKQEITNLLEKVRVGYSNQLAGFIQNLLVEDDKQRSSTEELLQYLSQPEIQQQNTKGLYTVEILNQIDPNLLQYNAGQVEVTPQPQVEKEVRPPANPTSQPQQPVQAEPVRSSQFIYDDEDLDTRIRIALANSRETIARYGITSAYVPPQKYVSIPTTQLHNPNNNYSNTDYSKLLASSQQQPTQNLSASQINMNTNAAAMISPLQVIGSSPLKASQIASSSPAPVRASNTAITYTSSEPVRASNTALTFNTTVPVSAPITTQNYSYSTVPATTPQYTSSTVSYQPITTTSTYTVNNTYSVPVQETPVKETKPIQIQARNFLNENTNAIETKDYSLPTQINPSGLTNYQFGKIEQTGISIPSTTLPSYLNGQITSLPVRQSQTAVSNPSIYETANISCVATQQPNGGISYAVPTQNQYTYTLPNPDVKDLVSTNNQVSGVLNENKLTSTVNTFANDYLQKYQDTQNNQPVSSNLNQNNYTLYTQNQIQPVSYTSYTQQQSSAPVTY